MRPADFVIEVDGEDASLDEVLPGFDLSSRLAIVTTTDCGGFGSATLLLAAVASWYERRQPFPKGFWEYPDFFALQVGGERGDFAQLDIWPPSKQPVIEPEAERIVAALCERSVNYVLVEDGSPRPGTILRETLNSVRHHLRGALAYSTSGHISGADVHVRGTAASERLIMESIDRSTNVPAAARAASRDARRRLGAMESFRKVSIETALGLLVPPPDVGGDCGDELGLSLRVREAHDLSPTRLAGITTRIGPP